MALAATSQPQYYNRHITGLTHSVLGVENVVLFDSKIHNTWYFLVLQRVSNPMESTGEYKNTTCM